MPSISPILSSSSVMVRSCASRFPCRCSSAIRRRHRRRRPVPPAACPLRIVREAPCTGLPGPSRQAPPWIRRNWPEAMPRHFTLAIEESDAGRAIHFVGAPCGEVDVQSVEIHFEVRHGLACVEHEHGTHLVGAADNRRDVGNRSCGIAHMRDGNDLRAVGDYFCPRRRNAHGLPRPSRTI